LESKSRKTKSLTTEQGQPVLHGETLSQKRREDEEKEVRRKEGMNERRKSKYWQECEEIRNPKSLKSSTG
jgi:hypothetical protein